MKATEREKAVIAALAAGFVADWIEAYILSRETPTNQERERTRAKLSAIVTRWKQRPDIAGAYNTACEILKAREQVTREKEREQVLAGFDNKEGDKEHTKNGKRAQIDYTRPENQRTLLNDLINTADDQKDKLDALKTIIQAQKDDKQAAKDNQIQRFYTPQRCGTCPLYQKAAKNLTI